MANILAREQGTLDLFDILNMADGILTIDEIKNCLWSGLITVKQLAIS